MNGEILIDDEKDLPAVLQVLKEYEIVISTDLDAEPMTNDDGKIIAYPESWAVIEDKKHIFFDTYVGIHPYWDTLDDLKRDLRDAGVTYCVMSVYKMLDESIDIDEE